MKTWRDMIKDLADGGLWEELRFTLLAGILAHGMALFNKLSWRGDLNHGFTLPLRKSVALGRWLKALMNYAVARVFGGNNLSLPLVHGAVSLVLIALSAHVILRLFDIRRRPLRLALCGMMVAFPVVACTFAYMFDAPYYFFGLLLAVLSVYISVMRPRWDGFVAAALCLGGCLAIYQAYFPVAVSLFVIRLIFEIARERHESLGKAILRGAGYLAVCAAALVLFFASWKVLLKLLHVTATDYQGASSIGQSGFGAYVEGVLTAYRRFLLRFGWNGENMYPMATAWMQWVLIAAGGACGLYIVLRHLRRDAGQALLMAVLMALLPLCFNLIYAMAASSPSDEVVMYSLMLYGQCMLYVFLVCAIDFVLDVGPGPAAIGSRAALVALAIMICMNIYLDNAAYLKAEIMIHRTISDLDVMVSRIKSTEGYSDKLPVCFVMTGEQDATFTRDEAFSEIGFVPFDLIYPYHQERQLHDFLEKWCGFNPKYVAQEAFEGRDEVEQMPDYPDAGSVKIIDDTVVVKW